MKGFNLNIKEFKKKFAYKLIFPMMMMMIHSSFGQFSLKDSSVVLNFINKARKSSLDSTDIYLDSALLIAKEINFKNGLTICYLIKGELNYYKQNNYLAEKILLKAISNTQNYQHIYNAKLFLAQVYKAQGDYELSLKVIDELLINAEIYNLEEVDLVNPLAVKARIFNHLKKTDTATKIIEKCYNIVNKYGTETNKIEWDINLSEQYQKVNKFHKALSILNITENKISNTFFKDSTIKIFYLVQLFQIKGKCYYEVDKPEKSINFLLKSRNFLKQQNSYHKFYINNLLLKQLTGLNRLNEAKVYIVENENLLVQASVENQIEFYKVKSDFLFKSKRYLESNKTMFKYISLKDSIFSLKTLDKVHQLELKYQKDKGAIKEALLKEENKAKNLKNILLLTLLILIIAVSIFIFFFLKQKNDKLINETLVKSKQLTTYSLKLAQKNNKLIEIGNRLEELHNSSNENKDELNTLQHEINYQKTIEKDWDEFKAHFENINKNFYEKLLKQYPTLTVQEIRLCALLFLGFSNQETQTTMNVSSNSIKSAKQRIKNKLNIGSTKDIRPLLMSL